MVRTPASTIVDPAPRRGPRAAVAAVFLALAGIAAAPAQPGSDPPVLEYAWSGGHSPYEAVDITIGTSGATRVVLRKRTGPGTDYATSLSGEELAAVRARVDSTAFFDAPADEVAAAKDTGAERLTVRAGSRTRTLSFRHRADLYPLTEMLWRLVVQAEAIHAIESDGDVYTAGGAVNPRLAGLKALQPDRLKLPLMARVSGGTDRQKVEWALEALSFITTPDEFLGFVAIGLDTPARRDLMLGIVGSQPFTGNIAESHLTALCPLYLAFVRQNRAKRETLNEVEKHALSAFTHLLGQMRYAPALPVLKAQFEEHTQPYVDAAFTPLAAMGEAALRVLIPYLDDADANRRANAAELLAIASRTGPRAGFSNPLPEHEYGRMIPVFTNTVLPKLRALAERDPSPRVRAGAASAAEEIARRVRE